MTKEEILNFFQTHRQELKEKFTVTKIGLFGSYANNTAHDESDIDIYVEFEKKKFKNIAGTWNYLEEHLGKKVDLLYPHKNMRTYLKKSIEKETIFG